MVPFVDQGIPEVWIRVVYGSAEGVVLIFQGLECHRESLLTGGLNLCSNKCSHGLIDLGEVAKPKPTKRIIRIAACFKIEPKAQLEKREYDQTVEALCPREEFVDRVEGVGAANVRISEGRTVPVVVVNGGVRFEKVIAFLLSAKTAA